MKIETQGHVQGKKKVGSRIDPWGTPQERCAADDDVCCLIQTQKLKKTN